MGLSKPFFLYLCSKPILMLKRNLILVVFPILFCCKPSPELSYVSYHAEYTPKQAELSENELKNWHHRDIEDDTIPGVSLEKAYDLLLKDKQGNGVVVAVIDMEVDIDHEDLKDRVWTNEKEVPGNGKDDDDNGYIDDIRGWNFLGNSKGENVRFMQYEYTRIICKYDSVFKDADSTDISPDQKKEYAEYVRARKVYDERMEYAIEAKKNSDLLFEEYYLAQKELAPYFPSGYSLGKLDSLKNIITDSVIKERITLMEDCIKYNITEEYVKDYKLKSDERIDKLLNTGYDERKIIGDDPTDISDTRYGNNRVNGNASFLNHGTLISGIIAANRANNIGIKGFSDHLKILPLSISAYGDEHDKDIALAIRYAVDNGAKIINMSFGKEFSLYKRWVDDAIAYAEQRDVLIITSASNDGVDLDTGEYSNYPDDVDDNGNESVKNFIKVGSSGHVLGESLVSSGSNYGKKSVDVFAPGIDIYTTSTKQGKYEFFNGTSPATAIVSGIAGLLFSYYPKLTAVQVKEIILQSGVSFDIDCLVPGDKNQKRLPFGEFSRSGKIVNAYNALLMAEKEFSE